MTKSTGFSHYYCIFSAPIPIIFVYNIFVHKTNSKSPLATGRDSPPLGVVLVSKERLMFTGHYSVFQLKQRTHFLKSSGRVPCMYFRKYVGFAFLCFLQNNWYAFSIRPKSTICVARSCMICSNAFPNVRCSTTNRRSNISSINSCSIICHLSRQ